jgi:hypothetical protein
MNLSFLILLLVLVDAIAANELKPRCGDDCWCIYYGEANECPEGTGISNEFPESFSVYATWNLTNSEAPYLHLRADDGSECFPFRNTLGNNLPNYPKSNLPQCVIPMQTYDSVCAYKFEDGTDCSGRNYEILTYDSSQSAQEDGAIVTHSGGKYVQT